MKLWISVLAVVALQAVWPSPASAQAPLLAAAAPCPWGSADCNVCVADAGGAISSLRRHGDAMGFHMNGTPDVEFAHHWQGIQRLMSGGGRYLAISRSLASLSTNVSFVVVEMATRNGDGQRFRSNRLDPSFHIPFTAPPLADRVVFSMPQESGYDHAGGMQALGNVLAIPFEGGPGSKVVFYDLSNPAAPERLDNVVDHSPLSDEAGTATLAKLQNGRFLLVIGRADANILDFYVSSGTDLRTTGFEFFDTWKEGELTGDDSEFGNYQNLNFLTQCDGSLFLSGTHRNSAGGFGDDFIDLFRVTNGEGSNVAIEKVARKHLFCNGNCDFDAAGGIYVDPAGQLVVYGTTHDNDGVPVNGYGPLQCAGAFCSTEFAEFRPVPHSTCSAIEDSWVELYDDAGFGDRSLMVDFVDRALEDYSNFDRAEGFEDKTSSVRWCLPPGATFRLWEDKNPSGGGSRDLAGDGSFHGISNLDDIGFGDATSAAEWLGGPFARAGVDRTLECSGPTTAVSLDGRSSISMNGDPLAFSWQAAGVTFNDASSATPTGSFPLAQSSVSLTVSDPAGSDTDNMFVTIVDTLPPTIACSANVVVDATSPAGATVGFSSPAAEDRCSVRSVSCTAPSGGVFPIGTTSVQCTANDFANHSAACSFTVQVKGPAEQAQDLIDIINGLPGVGDGIKSSLVAKLTAAITAIGSERPSACAMLQSLANEVQAQAGKELTTIQAAELAERIARMRAALGCVS
jgi:hypothetical protein